MKPTICCQFALPFVDGYPEEWRPVVGYEGLYEVSNFGRVRSLDRTVPWHVGTSSMKEIVGCLRTPQVVPSGHRYLLLYKDSKPQRLQVHAIVLTAFVGPRPEGYVCNHRDADPSNNHVSNLEWCTQKANIHHSMRLGRMRFPYGERQNKAKLTDENVRRIRRLAKDGTTRTELAALFGVSYGTIGSVIRRKYWKHVPED